VYLHVVVNMLVLHLSPFFDLTCAIQTCIWINACRHQTTTNPIGRAVLHLVLLVEWAPCEEQRNSPEVESCYMRLKTYDINADGV
jgi:hypothetical protein